MTAPSGGSVVTRETGEGADLADENRGPASLEVSGLVVDFGGLRAVDAVDLAVPPRSITGLIGPNGSGKTTLLDALSGLVTPSAGRVVVDGEDLEGFLPEERAALGMVRSFQDCRLYPELTVEDTLLVCEDARRGVRVLSSTLQLPWARTAERQKRDAVNRVMASFGLERFRNHRTSELSTGSRRVVDLASIVLAKPRLLLLDEPTAGIAQREAEAFIPLLRSLHEFTGATVLMVEHDVPLIFELCSTVVVMEAGRVVSAGSPEVVRRDPKALAAYLGASDEAIAVSGRVDRVGPGVEGAGGAADDDAHPDPGTGHERDPDTGPHHRPKAAEAEPKGETNA